VLNNGTVAKASKINYFYSKDNRYNLFLVLGDAYLVVYIDKFHFIRTFTVQDGKAVPTYTFVMRFEK